MVEATDVPAPGDLIYARWRQDKPAEQGYSRELISVDLETQYWDDNTNMPPLKKGCYTWLDYFEKIVQERPNDTFLGTRVKLNDKEFGEYEWMTYKQLETIS